MSPEKWNEVASSHLSADQRDAVQQARAALPADFDRAAHMARFQELNARIKAALPLDPDSEEAQAFLDERDAMLKPILAIIGSPEMMEAAKVMRATVAQGDAPSPIDAEVYRFYQEAAGARGLPSSL